MTGKEIFDIWAPRDSDWSLWANAIPFTEMDQTVSLQLAEAIKRTKPAPPPLLRQRSTLIIDLPGPASVEMGMSCANLGYRPVPLFNSHSAPSSLVDMTAIVNALRLATEALATITLDPNSAPAFLLDSNRLAPGRTVQDDDYDNRWLVFPQDFPSARRLLDAEISAVQVIQESGTSPAEDLSHVLARWQEAGIQVFMSELAGAPEPKLINVQAPAWYKKIWYRAIASMRFHPSSAGGFGGIVGSSGGG